MNIKNIDEDIIGSSLSIVNSEEYGEFSELGLTATPFTGKGLVYFQNQKFVKELAENKNISCIVLNKSSIKFLPNDTYGLLIVENPKQAFFNLHNWLFHHTDFYNIVENNQIDKNADISSHAIVAAHNVQIGKDSIIEDNVIIKPNVRIGSHVIIRAGSVIGGEAFQAYNKKGINQIVRSAGGVIIGDDCDIGYNTCIDKGVFNGNTILSDQVLVDNLVHIGHDVQIGEKTLIAANATIGGRTIIGENSWIGVGSIISNGLHIGNDCHVALGSVVTADLSDNGKVFGNPARRLISPK